MNLHQLKFVRETARQNFNLTAAARALFTSQPGISKSIAELESELGFEIFTRHGKRLCGLTEPGNLVLKSAELILQELDGLKRLRNEFSAYDKGVFTIAATHSQARYVLPNVVHAFSQKYPRIKLCILQGNICQISEMVLKGKADLAIANEAITANGGLVSIPCFDWEHVLIATKAHPIFDSDCLTVKDMARYPLVTYDSSISGRAKIDAAFADLKVTPDIRLEGIDADVIKTYVELGMGIGIIDAMAYDETVDKKLKAVPVGHIFGTNTSHVRAKRGTLLRDYVYYFIELLSPQLSREEMRMMFSSKGRIENVSANVNFTQLVMERQDTVVT